MTSELAGVSESDVLRTIARARDDPRRDAVFAFATKLTRDPATIARADVDRLRRFFSDAQIVELTFAVCRYNTMNRLADAFGVPLERENVFASPPQSPPQQP
jgi:alkylhydroperoxidase family enzyme